MQRPIIQQIEKDEYQVIYPNFPPIRFRSKRMPWNQYLETAIDALHPAFKPKAIEFLSKLSSELNKQAPELAIQINNTLRTAEDQRRLYQNRPQYAATIGNSPHEYGVALDFSVINTKTKQALTQRPEIQKIIEKIALETKIYWGGWFTSMPKEPWHVQIARDWRATYQRLCKEGAKWLS